MRKFLCLFLLCAAPSASNAADVWDLYDGANGVSSGVTCSHINKAGRLAWWHLGGDWVDATGKLWGGQPFASVAIEHYQSGRVQVPVTKALANGNRGLLL